MLSIGAIVVLVSTVGGIIFAVSVGSKPAQPEGLRTCSSETKVVWTQGFNKNDAEPEESSNSSVSSSSASCSSSSPSIQKKKNDVTSPVKRPLVNKEAKRHVTKNESDVGEATTVTKPPVTPSKTRIVVIAIVVSVLFLLAISGGLIYLFFFHWAPRPIPDPEPVPEPVQEPEPEEPKELVQSTLSRKIVVFSLLLTVIFYVWPRRILFMRYLFRGLKLIGILIRMLLGID